MLYFYTKVGSLDSSNNPRPYIAKDSLDAAEKAIAVWLFENAKRGRKGELVDLKLQEGLVIPCEVYAAKIKIADVTRPKVVKELPIYIKVYTEDQKEIVENYKPYVVI